METLPGPDAVEMTDPPVYDDVWFFEEQARVRNQEAAFNNAFGTCSPSTLQTFRCYAAILCIGVFDEPCSHLDSREFQSLKNWTPWPWRDDDCWRELCSRAIFADKGAMQLRSQTLALLWTLLSISGSCTQMPSQYQKPSTRFSPLQNLSLYNEVFGLPNSATIAFDPEKATNIIQRYGLGFDVSPGMRQVDASHLAMSLPITILLEDFLGEESMPIPAMRMILEMASIEDSNHVRFFMQHNKQNRHALDCQKFYLSCFLIACRMIPYKSKGILKGIQSLISSIDGREFRLSLLVSLKTSSKPEEFALIVAAMVSLDHFTPSDTLVAWVGLNEFCRLLDRQSPLDIDRAVIWHAAISLARAITFVYEEDEEDEAQPIVELIYNVIDIDKHYSLTRSTDRRMEEYWINRLFNGYSHECTIEVMCRDMTSLQFINRMQGTDGENLQNKRSWFYKWRLFFCV